MFIILTTLNIYNKGFFCFSFLISPINAVVADDEFPQGDRKVRGNINAMEQRSLNSTLGDLDAG